MTELSLIFESNIKHFREIIHFLSKTYTIFSMCYLFGVKASQFPFVIVHVERIMFDVTSQPHTHSNKTNNNFKYRLFKKSCSHFNNISGIKNHKVIFYRHVLQSKIGNRTNID